MSQERQTDAQAWPDEVLGSEQDTSLLLEALRQTPAQRLKDAQRLWDWFRTLHPRSWKPFWKSFDSFEELDRWKSEQTDPELW
jgi:hypothetical protein